MVKNEYMRYLKSKSTIAIIVILIVIGICSFYMSLTDKQMIEGQLSSNSQEINKNVLSKLVENYTWMKFIFNFCFVSDFYDLFIMIIFLWIGIFLSVIPFLQKENGFGNLIVTKVTYKNYIKSILKAQSLYICTVIATSMLILTVIAMFMGGIHFKSIFVGVYEKGVGSSILIALTEIVLLTAFTILINSICLLSNKWIKNKYLIQILPIALFIVVPMVVGNTLGNLSQMFADIFQIFIPFITFQGVYSIVQNNYPIMSIIKEIIPILIYSILFMYLFKINVKKYSEDYV